MSSHQTTANRENVVHATNGWMMLVLVIAVVLIDVAIVASRANQPLLIGYVILSLAATIIFLLPGFFSLQPNEARVLVLFGKYKGTVRESGFHWGNAFYSNGSSLSAQLAEVQKKAEKREFVS